MKEFVYKKNEIDFNILMNKTMKDFFCVWKWNYTLLFWYYNILTNYLINNQYSLYLWESSAIILLVSDDYY